MGIDIINVRVNIGGYNIFVPLEVIWSACIRYSWCVFCDLSTFPGDAGLKPSNTSTTDAPNSRLRSAITLIFPFVAFF